MQKHAAAYIFTSTFFILFFYTLGNALQFAQTATVCYTEKWYLISKQVCMF